ncbi:uncharacterized protein LOC134259476 [Saccostrea cucullata]|uniref:uncharacterized protein LOC134259476 n=1 Tax=Saccostrea cuccullata TaxID=36930 RepID=UPI002ED2378A
MPPVRTSTDTRGRKEYTRSFITPSKGRGRKRRREGERTGPHGDHTQHGVDQIPTPAGAIVNVASQSQPHGDELVGITTNQEIGSTMHATCVMGDMQHPFARALNNSSLVSSTCTLGKTPINVNILSHSLHYLH